MESGVSENAVSGHIQLVKPGETACFAVGVVRKAEYVYSSQVCDWDADTICNLISV